MTNFTFSTEPAVGISSSHLTTDTYAALSSGSLDLNTASSDTGTGGFVQVPGMDEIGATNIPEDLRTVLSAASSQGLSWVRFGEDAQLIEGLPVYGNGSNINENGDNYSGYTGM